MQRRVFISHAQNDADWPEAKVEAVAEAIRASGVTVSLDLWHQREVKRILSHDDWTQWIHGALGSAGRVLCLVSPRYRKLWDREPGVEGGYGFAFEAMYLKRALSLKKNNPSFVFTLRSSGRRFDSIRMPLAHVCPSYAWPADREALLSHLLSSPMPQRDLFNAPRQPDSGIGLSDGLILDGLKYPDNPDRSDSQVDSADGELIAGESATVDTAAKYVSQSTDDVAHNSITPEVDGLSVPVRDVSSVDTGLEEPISQQVVRATKPQVGKSGLWPASDEWRAPVGDFPPSWANAWGDDPYGLWADLTVNGVTQRMRWIEPSGPEGVWMGSTQQERDAIKHREVRKWADSDEDKPMRVVIAQGFWLAETPCTQALWQAVTGNNPSHFCKGREAPERPVESVSWNDVNEQFVRRFAQTKAWGTNDRLCLPTDEEWEYAARAGTRSAYWWGDAWDETGGNANVIGERRWDDKEGTTPVRRYAPNPWGLFDVHGNVWEWCGDPWPPRQREPEEDVRVVRGGSWIDHCGSARAACRSGRPCRYAGRALGIRFAMRSPAAR